MAYYAHAALAFRANTACRLNFIVPTGNLGNALACWLARRMGLPIGDIVLASNANDALPRYFAGGDYAPRASIATLANAMDVGHRAISSACASAPRRCELRGAMRGLQRGRRRHPRHHPRGTAAPRRWCPARTPPSACACLNACAKPPNAALGRGCNRASGKVRQHRRAAGRACGGTASRAGGVAGATGAGAGNGGELRGAAQ
jgi:hypothetical protein